jgi:hypothetical protein
MKLHNETLNRESPTIVTINIKKGETDAINQVGPPFTKINCAPSEHPWQQKVQ